MMNDELNAKSASTIKSLGLFVCLIFNGRILIEAFSGVGLFCFSHEITSVLLRKS